MIKFYAKFLKIPLITDINIKKCHINKTPIDFVRIFNINTVCVLNPTIWHGNKKETKKEYVAKRHSVAQATSWWKWPQEWQTKSMVLLKRKQANWNKSLKPKSSKKNSPVSEEKTSPSSQNSSSSKQHLSSPPISLRRDFLNWRNWKMRTTLNYFSMNYF